MGEGARDGILGHQFNKRLESFVPCCSQPIPLDDFKENHVLYSGFNNPYKKICEKSRVFS